MPQRTSSSKATPLIGLAMLLALLTASQSLVALLMRDPVLAQAPAPSFSPPPTVPSGSTVRVNGSTSMATINQALKKAYEAKYGGTSVTLAEEGSDAALKALLDGTIDIAAIGRPLTAEEKQKGLAATAISRHKIAIIVDPNNPFKGNITFEQFAKIFRGDIKDWSELGGAPGAIRFVDRPTFSDTRQAFRPYSVFQKAPFKTGATTKQITKDSTSDVIQALGSDGIGYAIADQVLDRSDVRIISMHKTLPDDPRYPFSQPLAYVYKGTPSPAVLAFLGVATAPASKAIIEAARETGTKADASPVPVSPAAPVSPSPAASPTVSSNAAAVPPGASEDTQGGFPWWLLLLPLIGIPLWLWLKGRRAGVEPVAPPPTATAPPDPLPPIVAPIPDDAAAPTGTVPTGMGGLSDIGTAGLAGATGLASAAALADHEATTPIESPPIDSPPIESPPIESPPIESPWIDSPTIEPPPAPAIDVPAPAVNLPEAGEVPDGVALGVGAAGIGAAGVGAAGVGAAALASHDDIAESPPIESPAIDSPTIKSPAIDHPVVPVGEAPVPIPDREGVGLPSGTALAAGAGAAALAGMAAGGTTPRSKITLTPHADQQAYAAWETPNDHKVQLRQQGGRNLKLRLYDVTGVNLTEQHPQSFQEFAVAENASTYTTAIRPDRDYIAEIGYVTEDHYWLALAQSNSIRIPAAATEGAVAVGGAALAAGTGMAALGVLGKAQTDVEATKYDVGQPDLSSEALASVDEGLPDLPEGYGDSRIVLMPRDPQWGYTYWDTPQEHKEALRQQGGQRLALRLYDVTNVDLNHESAHSLQQFDCDEMARDWYVPIPVSDRDYIAEIGYLTGDGRWLVLARSNPVRIPPIYPADWFEDHFVSVAWDDDLRGAKLVDLVSPETRTAAASPLYAQVFGLTQATESLRLAGSLFGSMQHVAGSMQQIPQESVGSDVLPTGVGAWAVPGVPTMSGLAMSGVGMSGVGMSGIGFGASMPPLRARKFWLVADAELIVYGATEPDATVTIDGRPIQLNPDGTFRFQMSFQDGVINFPIIAVAVDGEQTRSIHMRFDRETPHRHTNIKGEAVDELF